MWQAHSHCISIIARSRPSAIILNAKWPVSSAGSPLPHSLPFFLLDFPSVFPGFSQALRPLRRLFNCGTHLGALISFTWLLRCCCWPYHDLLRPIQEAVLLLPYHLSPCGDPYPLVSPRQRRYLGT